MPQEHLLTEKRAAGKYLLPGAALESRLRRRRRGGRRLRRRVLPPIQGVEGPVGGLPLDADGGDRDPGLREVRGAGGGSEAVRLPGRDGPPDGRAPFKVQERPRPRRRKEEG